MGIGDWGLGIGDWAQSPIPNPQSPIPNPQSPFLFNKGNCSIIDFNIFDYYCLRKITKKSTEIELFNFGLNFYKSQMDIINFFNIILLTQIMLTQKSDKKQNILSQTIELSIK